MDPRLRRQRLQVGRIDLLKQLAARSAELAQDPRLIEVGQALGDTGIELGQAVRACLAPSTAPLPTNGQSLAPKGNPPGTFASLRAVHAYLPSSSASHPPGCSTARRLRHVFADGGYAGEKLRDALKPTGAWTIEIIKCSDTAKGFELLPRRGVVVRTIAWLNRNRRLAKDVEQTIASATAWLFIASIQLFIRRAARR
jgi:transposase